MKSKNKILSSLNSSISNLVDFFLFKQGFFEEIDERIDIFDYEFVGDILSMINVNDYYINTSDMLLDIKNDIPSRVYLKYYDYLLEQSLSEIYTTSYFTYLLQNGYKVHK